jgi:uncharacterized protein YfaS (alpha-2-macroglobulin family)
MNYLLLLVPLTLTSLGFAKEARTLKLTEKQVATIAITPGRTTVLSFPSRPTKVILGNRGVFAVEYVENDIAIAALSANARSNLFVYLEGRRFAFSLSTNAGIGDEIILVRDASETKMEVKLK